MFETKRHIEVISILTCVIAASIGPVLLIGAHFSMNLPIAGLMFAFLSALIYRLLSVVERRIIIKHLNAQKKGLLGIFAGIVPFVSILFYAFSGDLRSMLFIRWNEGLASVPILLGCTVLLFIFFLITDRQLYSALYEVGYYFSLPMTIVILILPGIPNSEGKVLLINVAVVYFIVYMILTRITRIKTRRSFNE